MVKKLLILLVAVLLMAGCAEQMTVWTLSGTRVDNEENEFVGRFGLEVSEAIEVGGQSNWEGAGGKNQWYGVYVAYNVPIEADGILGQPYGLYQISGPWDQEDGGAYGPAFGTKYQLGKNVETIVEGWYRDFTGNLDDTMGENNQLGAYAGLRFKF